VLTKLVLALALVAGLGDKDFRVRERAQFVLTHVNNEFDLRGELRPLLAHPDVEVRERVARALAEYDDVWSEFQMVPYIWWFDRAAFTTAYDAANSIVYETGDEEGVQGDYAQRGTTAAHNFIQSLLDGGHTRQEARTLIAAAIREQLSPRKPRPVPCGVQK
jgi:hypothetical protein